MATNPDFCYACDSLINHAPEFAEFGVTWTVCLSLKANTGFNPDASPVYDDYMDLDLATDCLLGGLSEEIEAAEACDWKSYTHKFIENTYNIIKGIVCAIGGIWDKIGEIVVKEIQTENRLNAILGAYGGEGGSVPILRMVGVLVEASEFIDYTDIEQTSGVDPAIIWYAGDPLNGQLSLVISVPEMDVVDGVWAQVVGLPAKPFMQTVNVKSFNLVGSTLTIVYECFEFVPQQHSNAYDLGINFFVFGKKGLS